jgi:hypothetical protein
MDAMRSAHRWWTIGLSMIPTYLVACLVIQRFVFARRETAGFWPMSEQTFTYVVAALAVLAIVALPLVYVLKVHWAGKVPWELEVPGEPALTEELAVGASLFDSPRGRRFVVLFTICDTIAGAGLVLFLVQGVLATMLIMGTLAFLNYAAAYPAWPQNTPEDTA